MDLHRLLDAPLLLDERSAARLLLKMTRARGFTDVPEDAFGGLQTRFVEEPAAAIPASH